MTLNLLATGHRRVLTVVITLLGFFLASVSTASACTLITAGNHPDGWGAAHNLFSSAGELILGADCTIDAFTPEAGSSLTDETNFAVYSTGYYYGGSEWEPITYTPVDGAAQYGPWILGDAAADAGIAYQDTNTFFATYTCHWDGSDWNCGCQDEACDTPSWQLQAVRDPNVPDDPPAGPGGGGYYGGGAIPNTCGSDAAYRWIEENFAGTSEITGEYTGRLLTDGPPVWVDAATFSGGCDRGLLGIRSSDTTSAITNSRFLDMCPSGNYDDRISSTVQINNRSGDDASRLFVANSYMSPGAGDAAGLSSGNTMAGVYVESVDFENFQGDAAIETKSIDLQLSRVNISGPARRPIRVMREGVKYLADVNIDKPASGGWDPLIQVKFCEGTTLRIYNSSFNGSSRLERSDIDCWSPGGARGTYDDLIIEYLDVDPRTTGEMHPMFQGDCR